MPAPGGELGRFILRGQVIVLYRSFQRVLKQVPAENRGTRPCCVLRRVACRSQPASPSGDLYREIRREFELYRAETDLYAIKYHLSDGRARLKLLGEMLGLRA
jgi:hypothetical protein